MNAFTTSILLIVANIITAMPLVMYLRKQYLPILMLDIHKNERITESGTLR